MSTWGDDTPRRPYLVERWASWYWHRWRARRAVYYADLDYRRNPTPVAFGRWVRARDQVRRLELNRPWIPPT